MHSWRSPSSLASSFTAQKTRRADKKPAPPETGRVRLSLDIDADTKENIEILRERARVTSLTDVIKKSLALFDVATAHQAGGGTLIFRHPDGREERLLLI